MTLPLTTSWQIIEDLQGQVASFNLITVGNEVLEQLKQVATIPGGSCQL